MKPILNQKMTGKRGQSLVELALVLMILVLMLAGVVEYGFLLNNFLHVLDGARESARQFSNYIPFVMNGGQIDPSQNDLTFYYGAAYDATQVMEPLYLNPWNGDDIVVTVYSLSSNNTVVGFPNTGYADQGWHLCGNFDAFNTWMNNQPNNAPPLTPTPSLEGPPPGQSSHWALGWETCTPKPTRMSDQKILNVNEGIPQTLVPSYPLPPSTGVLTVEIYYSYYQILDLPVFTNSIYSIVPNPIPVYVYAIMPLSSAEPTPTP